MEELLVGCFAKIFAILIYTSIPIGTIVLLVGGIIVGEPAMFLTFFVFLFFDGILFYPFIKEGRYGEKKKFELPSGTKEQERQRERARNLGFPTYAYQHKYYHTKTNYPCVSEQVPGVFSKIPNDGRVHWQHVNTPYRIVADHSDPNYRYLLQHTTLAELRGIENRKKAIETNCPFYRRAIDYNSKNPKDYSFELTYETATDKPYTVEQVKVASLYEYDLDTKTETNIENFYNCFKYGIAYTSEKDKEPRRTNRKAISLSECKRLYDPLSMYVKDAYSAFETPKNYYRNDVDPCDNFSIYKDYLSYDSLYPTVKKLKEDEYTYILYEIVREFGKECLKVKYMMANLEDDDNPFEKLKPFLGNGTFLYDESNRTFYRLDRLGRKSIQEKLSEKYSAAVTTPYGYNAQCLILSTDSDEAKTTEISSIRKQFKKVTG